MRPNTMHDDAHSSGWRLSQFVGNPFRKRLILIVAVAAFFRLGFLLFGDLQPVSWDARRYAAAALGVISYFDTPSPPMEPGVPEKPNRLKLYYEKYIQGEPIDWRPYSPENLTQARGDIMVSGPVYPSILAIIFYITPSGDMTAARIFNILCDILSAALLFMIASMLLGETVGLVSGFLYASYFPFIQTSTLLLLETPVNLLLLLSIYYLLKAHQTGTPRTFIIAGVWAALAMLTKPTATLLAAPLAASYFLYANDTEMKMRIRRISLFVIPVVIVFFVWLGIASVKYGQLALRDPAYMESNLRQSSSTKFEGYDLDAISNDFWTRETYTGLFNNLTGYLGLAIKKFDRLWDAPFNDLHRSFILPSSYHDWWHRFLVITGLIGILVLALSAKPSIGWLVFIAGYYTLVHVTLHSVARYNFNAMPLMLIASSFALVEIGRVILARRGLLLKLVIPTIAISVLASLIDFHWVSSVFGAALSRSSVISVLVLKSILVVAALYLVGRLLLEGQSLLRRLILPIVAGALIISVTWTTALARDNWAEWQCRLDNPSKKAGTRLYISDPRATASEGPLLLAIDVTASKGRTGTYTVSVGNLAQQFVVGSKPDTRDFYFKPSYSYSPAQAGVGMEQLRQYAMINLTSSMIQPFLKKDGYVDITVAVDSPATAGVDYLTLYGRYMPDPQEAFIPSVRYTSLERWVVAGDPRIRVLTKFASDSAISYYIDRNASPEPGVQDLSPSPGAQTGRYDIFLVQWRNDSTVVIY